MAKGFREEAFRAFMPFQVVRSPCTPPLNKYRDATSRSVPSILVSFL